MNPIYHQHCATRQGHKSPNGSYGLAWLHVLWSHHFLVDSPLNNVKPGECVQQGRWMCMIILAANMHLIFRTGVTGSTGTNGPRGFVCLAWNPPCGLPLGADVPPLCPVSSGPGPHSPVKQLHTSRAWRHRHTVEKPGLILGNAHDKKTHLQTCTVCL